MGTYLMMLYVSLEQEKAVKNLFNTKGWGFKKPDLSMTTDKLGPTYASVDDNESESEGETTSKGRTRSRPATREASKRTPAVKIIKQSPKSEKKTSKVRVQLRKGGKKSTENAEFQEILEEAELITASINPADDEGEGEEIEPFTVKVERDGNMGEDSDYGGEDGESNDEDMDDDFDDVTPSTSYLEAGAESTDISQETADTPKPAKRRKVTTKARARPTLPPVDMDDLEAMGDLSPIKTDGDLDIRDELGFFKQDHDAETEEENNADVEEYTTSQHSHDEGKRGSKTRKKSSKQLQRHQCNKCDKSFASYYYLIQHERKHTGDGYECSECGKMFWTTGYLKQHMSSIHLGVKFECDYCESTFVSAGGLKKHMSNIHLGVKYECKECDSVYRSREALQGHMSTHTMTFKYTCPQCSKGFNSKLHFDDHMSSHAGMKQHKCHKCNTFFTGKLNMQRHVLVCGITDKNFICSQCGSKFKILRYLRDHIKLVHGKTELGCHKCGKLFHNIHALQRHFKICGVTDLDFECSQCSKKFKTKGYLNEHVKQKHEKRLTANCSECGEFFRYRAALQKHRKKTGHK